nr:2-succinyl-5-enolpyruvyl-6-hydroxy-3-cyclohexene-1-carboxylic-acid synthase [Janibacter alkaliphilus]
MTAARVLLDELVRLGVRDLVLCPGSRSAPLAYAAHELDEAGRLRLHVRVDERSAAFLALGLGKRSRRPAVVVTTSGSAVGNLHPAVLEAHHAAVPLILLTADRPPELRGVGANQATQQPGIFGGSVRLALDLETPAEPARQAATWRSAAGRAVAAATGALTGPGQAGPVHLNQPFRDPLAPGSDDPLVDGGEAGAGAGGGGGSAEGGDPVRGRPDGAPWVTLPGAIAGPVPDGHPPLANDERTLIVIGELPTPGLRRAALDWAAHHGAPVVAEPGPGTHDLVLPHGALLLTAHAWVEAHLPSRVLVVGRPTLGRAVPALTRRPGVRVEVITPGEPAADGWADATSTAAAVHPVSALVLDGDPGPPADPSAWAREWLDAGERMAAALDPDAARAATAPIETGVPTPPAMPAAPTPPAPLDAPTPRATLDGPTVAALLNDALPTGARLLLGSSSVARDWHLALPRPRPDLDVVTSRGLAGIDGLVSTAAGLALADPQTPTVALLGDLSFLHDAGGLVIGPDEPTPDLTIVVVDDDGGSIFTTLEHGADALAAPFARIFATPTRSDVAAVARAHGAAVVEVRAAADLAAAVSAAPEGLRVVRVPVDLHGRRSADQRRRDRVARVLAQPPSA